MTTNHTPNIQKADSVSPDADYGGRYVPNPKATDFIVMGDGWRVRRLGWDGGRFWYQAEWDCHPAPSVRTTNWQEAEQWARVHLERASSGIQNDSSGAQS